jgi:hypothetical protein
MRSWATSSAAIRTAGGRSGTGSAKSTGGRAWPPALRLLLEIVDDRPLLAHVAAHNAGSIRVLERCGFSLLHETTASDGVREYLYELPA